MIRLKPSEMTSIRAKLKASKNPLHTVRCMRCGWHLSARSVEELESVGWEVRLAGCTCATCLVEGKPPSIVTMLPAGAIPYVDTTDIEEKVAGGRDAVIARFSSLPAAPVDAFPRVGGKGERHWQTSRPAKEA